MIILFDIDGTLTEPMKCISPSMRELLSQVASTGVELGIIGGSNVEKAAKQLGQDYRSMFTYNFHENGCVFYRNDTLEYIRTLEDFVEPACIDKLIRFVLRWLADADDIPIRRGTFIERRSCMLNISPIGRDCSYAERESFFAYDRERGIRQRLVDDIRRAFPDLPLDLAIGGMISIDVFPAGLNKTYCLASLPPEETTVHFFGDRCDVGGNDHEIYADPRTIGHRVNGPDDTMRILKCMFFGRCDADGTVLPDLPGDRLGD